MVRSWTKNRYRSGLKVSPISLDACCAKWRSRSSCPISRASFRSQLGILRIHSVVNQLFREFLLKDLFSSINTVILISIVAHGVTRLVLVSVFHMYATNLIELFDFFSVLRTPLVMRFLKMNTWSYISFDPTALFQSV